MCGPVNTDQPVDGGQRLLPDIILHHYLPYFLRKDLSLNLEFINLVSLVSEVQESTYIYLNPQPKVIDICLQTWPFTWVGC